MARGGVSFRDAQARAFTFKLASGITVADEGKAVTATAAQTAGLGTSGKALLGKLVKVEGDGLGTVEISGCLYLPYNSTAPTIGGAVQVDGEGNIKDPGSGETGRGIVIDTDATNKIAVVVL